MEGGSPTQAPPTAVRGRQVGPPAALSSQVLALSHVYRLKTASRLQGIPLVGVASQIFAAVHRLLS